jgi:hypothetical protein
MSKLPVSVSWIENCTDNVVDDVLLLRLCVPLETVVLIVHASLELQPTPDKLFSTAEITLVWADPEIDCVYSTFARVPKKSGRLNSKIILEIMILLLQDIRNN